MDDEEIAAIIRSSIARRSYPSDPLPGGHRLMNMREVAQALFPIQPLPDGAQLLYEPESEDVLEADGKNVTGRTRYDIIASSSEFIPGLV